MVLANGGSDSSPRDQAAPSDTSTKDSLGDAISAALDGGSKAAAAEAPKAEAEPTDDSAAPDAGTEQATAKDKAKPAEDGKEVQAQDKSETSEAPQHWPAERRQAFAALPKDAQKIVSGFVKDLTGGYTRKMQEVGDQVKFASSVRSLFNDTHRQQMQREGVDDIGALRNLVQLHDYASKDPVGYVKWAMQRMGVTVDHLAPQTKQPDKTAAAEPSLEELLSDPKVKTLEAQLQELVKWKSDREAAEQNAQRSYQQQQVSTLQSAIGTFRSMQDDHGQLKYPHFDKVGTAMGALMESHPKLRAMPDSYDKLDLAYHMAVRADPELSEPVIESEVSRRMAEQAKKAEAERAKRVAGVRPSSGAPSQRPRANSLDSALEQSFSQLGI